MPDRFATAAEVQAAVRTARGRASVNAHKALMATIVLRAKLHGYVCHFVHDSRHSPAGKLDLTLRRPRIMDKEKDQDRMARWIEAEIKTGKAVLTDEPNKAWDQMREVAFLREHFPNIEVRVWRDTDDLDAIERDLAAHWCRQLPSGSGPGTPAWDAMLARKRPKRQ